MSGIKAFQFGDGGTPCPECGRDTWGYCYYCGHGKRPHQTSTALALELWDMAQPAGRLIETYLRSRGLTVPLPMLRFLPDCYHKESGTHWPVMIAPRTAADGTIVAIHRTYLVHTGRGKAPINPPRKDLGPASGTAIRLSNDSHESHLVIGEGIETTASVMQQTGQPGWAAGSAVMLAKLMLPAAVRSSTVLADGDEAGINASRAAAARWLKEGRQVRIAYAPAGKDFNDLLIAGANNA